MPANVCNYNWFASNMVRKYPLDSMSSCISDENEYLPDNIITDIHLSFPSSLGNYCYISAANITDNLVSIVLTAGYTPIAALCTVRPIDECRYYMLDSLYSGVTGVVSLGVQVNQPTGKWTFSNINNSRILPTCCSPYTTDNVSSLSRPYDSNPFKGNVLLTAGNDIKLDVSSAIIDGKKTSIVYIGLDTLYAESVLNKYTTACEVTTEMDTCGKTTVTSIGSAIPSCSGNITIASGSTNTIEVVNDTLPGVIVLKSNRKLSNICRDYSPFDIEETGEGTDHCVYPTERSDDICKVNNNHPCNGEYPSISSINPTHTVDLYGFDLTISDISDCGLIYETTADCSFIKPADTTDKDKKAIMTLNANPASFIQFVFNFNKLDSDHVVGVASVSVGNDTITIDNGIINYVVDSGSLSDNDQGTISNLIGINKFITIEYTKNKLIIVVNNNPVEIANIDDGLSGDIIIRIGGDVQLEGIRYDKVEEDSTTI